MYLFINRETSVPLPYIKIRFTCKALSFIVFLKFCQILFMHYVGFIGYRVKRAGVDKCNCTHRCFVNDHNNNFSKQG